jgi:hypothetical protein
VRARLSIKLLDRDAGQAKRSAIKEDHLPAWIKYIDLERTAQLWNDVDLA